MKKFLMSMVFVSLFSLPLLSFAIAPITPLDATTVTTTSSSNSVLCSLAPRPTLASLFGYATCLINKSVVPLIFSLALVMFIWGVVQYVINDSEEARKAKGKMFMIWGIIALAVMVSVWGLVGILGNTFNINNAIPQVNTKN